MTTGGKILIALDSFKGSINSLAAGRALKTGLETAGWSGGIDVLPIADGGEGLVDGLAECLGGDRIPVRCRGPQGDPVDAAYLLIYPAGSDTSPRAALEMAASSGLPLIAENNRNPMIASTWGVGEQILAARARGATEILIGIGGSATVDGGMGMASALGVTFIDADGTILAGTGADMRHVARVDLSGLVDMSSITFQAACDVDNPLLGTRGAAAVYGPQKGATPEMIPVLEEGLRVLYDVMESAFGRSVRNLPGSSAAGGLGAMLALLLHAELKPGAALILETVGFKRALSDAQLVITGEGRIDSSSRFGKAPFTAATMAGEAGVPCVAVCGSRGDGAKTLSPNPFRKIFALTDIAQTVRDAIARPADYLQDIARSILTFMDSR